MVISLVCRICSLDWLVCIWKECSSLEKSKPASGIPVQWQQGPKTSKPWHKHTCWIQLVKASKMIFGQQHQVHTAQLVALARLCDCWNTAVTPCNLFQGQGPWHCCAGRLESERNWSEDFQGILTAGGCNHLRLSRCREQIQSWSTWAHFFPCMMTHFYSLCKPLMSLQLRL